jgi:hypothetical protein
MLVPDSSSGGTLERSRPERPPPCLRCQAPSWWNGWREVFVVDGSVVDGSLARRAQWLARAKCTVCRRSFTCYQPGHYPHRQYQLDVVGDVVAAIAIGSVAASAAAAPATASPTSGRRWTAWVAQLVAPAVLLAVAQKLDPDAAVGAGVSTAGSGSETRSLAARVLGAFEELGAARVRGGVALASRTGLGRVLEWQHRLHGDVVYLVAEPRRLSPAMALGLTGGPPVGSEA